MDRAMEYIEPFVGNYDIFLLQLREHQLSKPHGPSLTDDQIVYVAGVLRGFIRQEFDIGGMQISDPTDLAIPEVLEYLFHHPHEAELAGAYLMACMGAITAPHNSSKFPTHRVNLYDIIGRACYGIAAEASKKPGHRHMMRSIKAEYREIRKEVTRFIVHLNQPRFIHRPS